MFRFARKVIDHKGRVFHPGQDVPETFQPFTLSAMLCVGDIEEACDECAAVEPQGENPPRQPAGESQEAKTGNCAEANVIYEGGPAKSTVEYATAERIATMCKNARVKVADLHLVENPTMAEVSAALKTAKAAKTAAKAGEK